MGQAPPSKSCNKDGNGTIFVKVGEFGEKNPRISEWTSKPIKIAKEGDILICVVGSIGEINIASFPCAIGRSVAAIRSKSKDLDQKYLFYFLKNQINYFKKKSQGVAQAVITKEMINSTELLLPSLGEQQRIASILDKATSVKEKRKQGIAKLDELVQTIYYEMFNNCPEKVSIRDIVINNRIIDNLSDDSIWSLSLEHVESQSGNLINKIMIDRKKLGSSTFYFQPPVVLYSKLRPYLNKVIIPKESGYATSELIPLYLNDKVLPIFLATVLRSKKFVEYANINSVGAKMPRVIMDKFWDYKIPLPIIDKQQKFLKIFNSIENTKKNYLNSHSQAQLLINSIQHQAFTAGSNI